jgi:uncharacterized RDD family membrane protein YckC
VSDVIWYREEAGQQVGPIDDAAMNEAIRFGRLAPGTRVWRAGMAEWQPWESLPEFAAFAPPRLGGAPARPPPPQATAPFPGDSHAAEILTGAGAGALYPKAPLGARFVAAVLDNLLSVVPSALLVAATVGAASAERSGLAAVLGVLAAGATIWALWYMFTKDGRPNGQSIGKKAMGLMVVHLASGRPCSRSQSALRYLVLLALNLVPYVGWLVEPIVLLSAAGGRRLGDSAAGTQVIAVGDYRPKA